MKLLVSEVKRVVTSKTGIMQTRTMWGKRKTKENTKKENRRARKPKVIAWQPCDNIRLIKLDQNRLQEIEASERNSQPANSSLLCHSFVFAPSLLSSPSVLLTVSFCSSYFFLFLYFLSPWLLFLARFSLVHLFPFSLLPKPLVVSFLQSFFLFSSTVTDTK